MAPKDAPGEGPADPTRLLSVTDLPAWMRDNDYLHAHYRPNIPSLRSCLSTAFFRMSNETVNVWSHFIGLILFAFVAARLLGPVTAVARHAPAIPPVGACVTARHPDFSCVLRGASAALDRVSADALGRATAVSDAVHDAKDAAAAAVHDAKDAAAAAVHDAKDAAASAVHDAKDAAAAVVHDAKDAAAAAVHDAKDVAAAVVHDAKDAAAAVVHDARDAAYESVADASARLRALTDALRRAGLPNAHLPHGFSKTDVDHAVAEILREHRRGMLPLLLAACFCMAASTLYHVFWVYSRSALDTLGKLDFMGIACLCSGHAASGVFYAFYCRPQIARIYYVCIACACLSAVYAIFSPGFHTPSARLHRTLVFSALGGFTILPLAHAGVLHQWSTHEFRMVALTAMAALCFYFTGAVLYASRWPECCRPGKHDRFCSSHQLMHFAVVAGASIHLNGCYNMMSYRLEHGCSVSPLLF